jgi:phospholipid/cholesterol/gamma-HCH transport system substrate-binding protein
LKSLDPVVTQLTKAGTDLPKAAELLATYPFPKTAVDGVRGDYTNLYVTTDLNLTTLLNNLLKPVPPGVPLNSASNSAATIPGVSP